MKLVNSERSVADGVRREAAKLRRQVLDHVRKRYPQASNARQYLHPSYAAEMLGYEFQVRDDLDLELRLVDATAAAKRGVITGLLDRPNRVVAVSQRYSPEEQRFAGAHELGHLILHPGLPAMHRDRLDRPTNDPLERGANGFAAAYLMPARWIRGDVKAKFGQCPIRVTENIAWWLDRQDPERFLHANPERDHALALALANCSTIGSERFPSMQEEYGVTAQAMAWRLVELQLIIR